MSPLSAETEHHTEDAETGQTKQPDGHVESEPLDLERLPKDDERSDDHHHKPRSWILMALVVLMGCAAAGAILAFGITSAKHDQELQFERQSEDLLDRFQKAFNDYELAGLWLHQATLNRDEITHQEFRVVYEYMISGGLELQGAGFARNVSHAERPAMEDESRTFFEENYPGWPYKGFTGLEFRPGFIEPTPGPRSNQTFYFPLRFTEPMEDFLVRNSLDLDMFSLPPHRRALTDALTTWKPAMTERLRLSPEFTITDDEYFVILFHPGVPVSANPGVKPQDCSALTIRVPEILKRSNFKQLRDHKEQVSLYIFDSTDSPNDPAFLAGANFDAYGEPVILPETNLTDLRAMETRYRRTETMQLASREWTFVAVANEDSFEPQIVFVILGATIIFVASLCVAVWIYTDSRRVAKLNEMQAAAKEDKTAMRVESANRVAQRERELNDFIAHEVRNPLSAALSACSFVKTAVYKTPPLVDEESQKSAREDVAIIDRSLQFINDLLRNMLDMHRASSNQLKIEMAHADVLRDVLEPSVSMLYHRSEDFQVLVDCPDNLVVLTDRLRLKQIVLNLGRNAAKFVTKGFVRFRGAVVDGLVVIYVEDSGPGIPEEKHDMLFLKFQESLDSLNQGTGIGLCLCKRLSVLLQADIWLDKDYDSGIAGCPGTRFVISLNVEPVSVDSITSIAELKASSLSQNGSGRKESSEELPEIKSILFVDDDMMLRKLFSRSIRNHLPKWKVDEAANGETALQLVDSKSYDIIFLDQYMASTNKQLLGTETAQALRAKGIDCCICGLSANDMERQFLAAGANAFRIKPFPCDKEALAIELIRILKLQGSYRQIVSLSEKTEPEPGVVGGLADRVSPDVAEVDPRDDVA